MSAYEVTSWNPSVENVTNIDILVVKYKASLEPLSQSQKDRLLSLAQMHKMQSLIDALIQAGAK